MGRSILTRSVVGACACVGVAHPHPHTHGTRGAGYRNDAAPPNIIIIQVDSMDGRLLDPTSPMSQKVTLPTLRGLASAGTVFANTYTSSPQCVPSRTSMLTSRYVHEISTWNNGMGMARSTSTGALDSGCVSAWSNVTCTQFAAMQNVSHTWFDSLRHGGYSTNILGRIDAGNGFLDEYVNATGDGFHGGPGLDTLARAADIRRATKPDPASMVNSNDPDPFNGDIVNMETTLAYMRSVPPGASRPFLLLIGFLVPHPPYDTNASFVAAVNESAVDVPPVLPQDSMHPFDTYMSTSKAAFGNYTHETIKSIRRAYWGAVAEADALIGDVLRVANETGYLDNTVVVFTSDHGENAMEHRQDFKNALYEASARVPLMFTSFGTAQHIPAGQVVTNLTTHLDLYPTLMDLAGLPTPPNVRGHSLAGWLGGQSAARPDYIASQYHSNMGNTGSFMLRQGPWKYITFGRNFPVYANYSDMLYNLDDDPHELSNVAVEFPSVVEMMLATLEAELGESVQSIDLRAKENDLALYRAYFQLLYNKTMLYNKFEATYSGFDAGDAEKVQDWCGEYP